MITRQNIVPNYIIKEDDVTSLSNFWCDIHISFYDNILVIHD